MKYVKTCSDFHSLLTELIAWNVKYHVVALFSVKKPQCDRVNPFMTPK